MKTNRFDPRDTILNDERLAHILHEDDDSIKSPNGHHRADFYNHVDENAKKWPPGYWEKYEALREEARTLCGYRHMNVVALLNGYFEVRFRNRDGHEFAGPQRSERQDALTAFIAEGSKLRSGLN